MDEAFYSGYCRQLDQTRMVLAEFRMDGNVLQLDHTDCCYPDCKFASECTIAQAIKAQNTGDTR